jgi:FkbM family methyltransferase
MSLADRTIGLARSLLVYHAIPLRQRRMQRLYRRFARPGDLVFDVGAHVGNRARALAAIGCRVVALEPQPDFARVLRTLFARNGAVQVVEAAVATATGEAWLSVSDRTPTVSTLAAPWRDARAQEAGFGGVEWNREVRVRTVTLDELIARHGDPAFVKIDVEGGADLRRSPGGVGRGRRRLSVQLVGRRELPAGLGRVARWAAAGAGAGRARTDRPLRRRLRPVHAAVNAPRPAIRLRPSRLAS